MTLSPAIKATVIARWEAQQKLRTKLALKQPFKFFKSYRTWKNTDPEEWQQMMERGEEVTWYIDTVPTKPFKGEDGEVKYSHGPYGWDHRGKNWLYGRKWKLSAWWWCSWRNLIWNALHYHPELKMNRGKVKILEEIKTSSTLSLNTPPTPENPGKLEVWYERGGEIYFFKSEAVEKGWFKLIWYLPWVKQVAIGYQNGRHAYKRKN